MKQTVRNLKTSQSEGDYICRVLVQILRYLESEVQAKQLRYANPIERFTERMRHA